MYAFDTAAMTRVLVVDDEPAVRHALERALRLERYDVGLAADGQEALDLLATGRHDVVVLDIAMPRIDGFEVCRRLRAAGDRTPVLMLTAKDAIDDRVDGLDAGADDYLVKPFALRELKARLRALLRRSEDEGNDTVLRYADLSLDPLRYEVRRGERRIELTRTEFGLLQLFLEHPRQVLTRSQIFERSGAMTSARRPTRWASTSATCAARPRRTARPASSIPCAASATCCAKLLKRLFDGSTTDLTCAGLNAEAMKTLSVLAAALLSVLALAACGSGSDDGGGHRECRLLRHRPRHRAPEAPGVPAQAGRRPARSAAAAAGRGSRPSAAERAKLRRRSRARARSSPRGPSAT